MAITLTTTFASGASRSGSEVNQNMEDVREWLNGQIATADIVAAAGTSRLFLRPEHNGAPLDASLGTTTDVYGTGVGMDQLDRAHFFYDVAGSDYVTVPALARTIHVERESLVRIKSRFYAWAAFTSDAAAGQFTLGVVAMAKLFVNSTAENHTTRRITITDNGTSSPTATDKREHGIVHQEVLAAGYHDIAIKIRVMEQTKSTPLEPLDDTTDISSGATGAWTADHYVKRIDVESRSMRIEILPFKA